MAKSSTNILKSFSGVPVNGRTKTGSASVSKKMTKKGKKKSY